MRAYERIEGLKPGETIYVDYHDTLFFVHEHRFNWPLIRALRLACGRGVKVVLWTGGDYWETIEMVERLGCRGLRFDDVMPAVWKPGLIVDDVAVGV